VTECCNGASESWLVERKFDGKSDWLTGHLTPSTLSFHENGR
jgi:hypothetical protein